MKLGKALGLQATQVATYVNTTINATTMITAPFGRGPAIKLGGKGRDGNYSSGGNYASGGNFVAASGGNYLSGGNYVPPSGGNVLANSTPNPPSGGNYASGGSYVPPSGGNVLVAGNPGSNPTYVAGNWAFFQDFSTGGPNNGMYSTGAWGPNLSQPVTVNESEPGYAHIQNYTTNTTTPGTNFTNTTFYNPYVAGYTNPIVNNPLVPVPANPTYYNPYTAGFTNTTFYNPFVAAYTTPTNYNPYIAGSAGAPYSVGGVSFPGGPADSTAPVVSPTPSTIKYVIGGVSVTVVAGGYVNVNQ